MNKFIYELTRLFRLPILARLTILWLVPLTLITSTNEAHASHVMGVEMVTECLNTCTTRVKLRVYRDCSGSLYIVPTPFQFVPTVANCGNPTPLANWSTQAVVEVTPICPSQTTLCTDTNATFIGVQEYFWYRDYDICSGITPNCEYDMTWTTCCRNAIITSGTAQSIYVSNHYTIAQGCNNSPVYMNTPLFYACAGATNSIFMGGSDPDGDSLVYTLDTCRSNNSTTPFTYGFGYTPTIPLGTSWDVTVGPLSGVLTLTPNPGNNEVGVICITTNEYRNGVLIGSYTRDIQVAILTCPPNTVPGLGPITNVSAGASVTAPNTVTVCAGTPLCFDLEALDPDTANGQVVTMLWDQSIPGATFTQTGAPTVTDTIVGNSPNGTFCWNNPVAGVYPMIIGMRDNACPVFTYIDKTVYLQVLGNSFPAIIQASSPTTNSCSGNLVTLSVTGGPYNNYLWSTGDTTSTLQVLNPGTYGVTVTLGTCNVAGSGTFTLSNTSVPDVSGTVTLSNGTTPLQYSPVYLITHDSTLNALTAFDTTISDANGYYEFCSIPSDTFYLKAAPQLPAYPNHLPTYADTAIYFNNAAFFESSNAPLTVDWSVRSGTNPGGSGFIGGLISQGANKQQGVGDPVPDLQVFLYATNSGQFIGTTTSDVNGYFSFANLPLGDYQISVDVPNVDEINVPTVTLSSQIPSQDSLDLRLHSTYLELVVPTNTTVPISSTYFRIFPNPANGDQQLDLFLAEAAQVNIGIYDVMGREVVQVANEALDQGSKRYTLAQLPSGSYFLKVRIGKEQKVQRITRW